MRFFLVVSVCGFGALLVSFVTLAEAHSPLGILSQAEQLPDGFEQHFFDVPLAVRVDLDKQYLGDALVVLGRDETIRLLSFTDTQDSTVSQAKRDTWLQALSTTTALGSCTRRCSNDLVALHYNLQDSQLSILTANIERSAESARFHALPEQGSFGLLVNNQLNIAGGGGPGSGTAARYSAQATGSLGNWTQVATAQLVRTGAGDSTTYHSLNELYGQRELEGNFFRLGYFTPDALGVYRRPRNFGGSPDTTLGFMFGTSDSLSVQSASPSTYPVYVTPARPGTVEVWRNGVLIHSQVVVGGLQTVDTRPLPSGIYPVQVRLIEDGQVTSTTEEIIYKPNNWSNADQRWRYNVFGGKRSRLLDNWTEGDARQTDLTYGGQFNYLLHPRVILGLNTQRVAQKMQYGSSIDWTLTDELSFYTNVYQTTNYGTGLDLQARYQYQGGSVMFSHSRSWLDTRDSIDYLDKTLVRPRHTYNGRVQNSSLSLTRRLNGSNSVSARLSHSSGNTNGAGVNLGWQRSSKLFGNEVNWQLSAFDRPSSISTGNQRNRGLDLSMNLALGKPGRSLSASLGTRTSRDGERELNGTLGYNQTLDGDYLKAFSASMSADSFGVGLSGTTQFETAALRADAYAQRTSYQGYMSGGLNLNSTVALGAGTVAASGSFTGSDGAMIVDLQTDVDDLVLSAEDMHGGSAGVLKPGRNLVPITAFRGGKVQFDLRGSDDRAVKVQPSSSTYHINKGGVAYQQLNAFKTLSVLGRLVDPQGRPLGGAYLINHASSGVSEADGFFVMEMSESVPTLEIRHGGRQACNVELDPARYKRENNILQVAEVVCRPETARIAHGA